MINSAIKYVTNADENALQINVFIMFVCSNQKIKNNNNNNSNVYLAWYR